MTIKMYRSGSLELYLGYRICWRYNLAFLDIKVEMMANSKPSRLKKSLINASYPASSNLRIPNGLDDQCVALKSLYSSPSIPS